MKILLVVDVQNDFCPGGELGVPEGDHIIPIINRMIDHGGYDLIVASEDWHPANHCSFGEWPIHCVQGTQGAELHSDLHTSAIDKIIQKGSNPNIDSYSAFFDNAKLEGTGLVEYLTEQAELKGETLQDCEVHVVGLALDYCVKFSALDAQHLGLKTTVVYDATRAVNKDPGNLAEGLPSDEQKALQELQDAGISIITSVELDLTAERGRSTAPLEQSLAGDDRQRGIAL